ncbi:MAG: hypothetical protein OEW68_04015 [Gammaproteobacteria bacterium]|nr:hypothetical protein [Gammaproteobacteria bacterium]MDH4313987.1 hypothetical protein [Gammaproteobacteria bacterium]MDH5212721.1 hypothetical protein [Gammaproteobacteria bacterium]
MTISISRLRSSTLILAAAALLLAGAGHADETEYQFDGHTKGRVFGHWFPDDSIFNELTGTSALDIETDLRLNLEAKQGPWAVQGSYQLFALHGDRIEYSRNISFTAGLTGDRLPDDRRRLLDLTSVIRDDGEFATLHRLDRLWFDYTGNSTVLRVGRQAITWGNGFFFSPMDIVNPFDPTAIDTEYKAGDDMLYGQYLRKNGHDIQAAVVFRRDPLTGDPESTQSTLSVKYHGIVGNGEFDALVARSYGDTMFGIGGNRDLGGAVWRGDVLVTLHDSSATAQLVTNLNHSWTWLGKNVSGVVEYYYSGFGIGGGHYDAAGLAENAELLRRISRGELFTLGRNYLAGGITVEMTPLWTLTPNLFANLDDKSAFFQIVTQYSLGDNATFLGALSIPMGPQGTEYGGIESGLPDQYVSTDLAVFAQLAWYF